MQGTESRFCLTLNTMSCVLENAFLGHRCSALGDVQAGNMDVGDGVDWDNKGLWYTCDHVPSREAEQLATAHR